MSGDISWWIVFIVSFLVALTASALCSLAESVLLSLTDAQIVEISKKSPKIGAIWENFKKDLNQPITSILAINTTAHTVGAAFAGAAFAKLFGESWVWLFSLVFTFLMLQYTEILPKTIGVRFNQSLAYVVARPLALVTMIGDPIIHMLRFFNKPFEMRSKIAETTTPVSEITSLTTLARRKMLLDAEQERIILATLKLSNTEVQNVMIPFDEVSTLSDDMTTSEAVEIAQNDSHTRFPVYYGSNQNFIVGYVNFKELVARRLDPSESSWGDADSTKLSNFVRSIIRVKPTDKVSEVLNHLVKNHDHIALVTDSDQKENLGILTLEDLVEELVGEIEDEFDRLPETLQEFSNIGMIRAGGGLGMDKVADAVSRVFPGSGDCLKEEISQMQNPPRVTTWIDSKLQEQQRQIVRNSRVDCGELSFWVKRVRRGQVFDVVILHK